MKVLILASGLGTARRGYERFVMDLAGQLRSGGLTVGSWGSAEAPGVEGLPILGREKLAQLALAELRRNPRFASLRAPEIHDWTLHSEDHLFGIAAAARLEQELARKEPLIVYLKWQGGLIDAGGGSTALFSRLARGVQEGSLSVIVHTDWVYPAVISRLADAGMAFHSIAPWVTSALREIGVSSAGIVELPMGALIAPLRQARSRGADLRHARQIPADAFVILSAGAFDNEIKNYPYLVRELAPLSRDEKVYWVVAGPRGGETSAWERQAQELFGPRFIPLVDVPFDQMPEVYALADLFLCGSLNETFGLVYIEAQLAGLPCVMHDYRVTQWIASASSAEHPSASRVDMRKSGVALAAVGHWRDLLSTAQGREATAAVLERFRSTQETRFAWENLGPRYAQAFRSLSEPGASQARVHSRLRRPAEEKHERGLLLFQSGKPAESLAFFGQSLLARETAERWNDWATAQMACNRPAEAEPGYRRALELDPANPSVLSNLAILLIRIQRSAEAIPLFERCLPLVTSEQRPTVESLLQTCRAANPAERQRSDRESRKAYLEGFAGLGAAEQYYFRNQLDRYLAMLEFLPDAQPGQRLLELGAAFHHLTPALVTIKGYSDISCADVWEGEPRCTRRVVHRSTGEAHEFSLDNFDIQSATWPYPDASFDVVLFCEMLEHLIADPMQVMSEINRILKPGGLLLISTPNVASSRSVEFVLRRETPYFWSQYEIDGRPTDRHNREYTPGEVERLAKAAGFAGVKLETPDVWTRHRAALPLLAAYGLSIALRGDSILYLGKKQSAVRERYPAEFYSLVGGQEQRRLAQSGEPLSDSAEPVHAAAQSQQPLRILVVHEILPETDHGGSEVRLLQVLRELRAQGHAVTYVARMGRNWEQYGPQLHALGINVIVNDAERLRFLGLDRPSPWTLEQVLRLGRFDLAILSHWYWCGISIAEHYLEDIRRFSPETRIAVLSDDRHGLRESRMAELTGSFADRERASDFQARETAVYRRADFVLAISEDDRRGFLADSPDLVTELLPMIAAAAPAGPPFADRKHIFFLGNYFNPANRDGIDWFLASAWPEIHRHMPRIQLRLAGSNMPKEFSAMTDGIAGLGQVADLEPLFAQHRIFVSPIRFGTGIKTKNLAALAHGIPLVTTTIGAEGMSLENGVTALIADDADSFVDAVVRLYRDSALWQKLAKAGRAHILDKFSAENLRDSVSRIAELARRLRPKPFDPAYLPSYRLVERFCPDVLEHQPGNRRIEIRTLAYARLAEQFLSRRQPAEALEQLRHIFQYVRGPIPRNSVFVRVLLCMERCYRELGDLESAARCAEQAQSCHPEGQPPLAPSPAYAPTPVSLAPPPPLPSNGKKKSKKNDSLALSVIIPTFNRRDTLRRCLEALRSQTLSASDFEVIVVDDGWTDGTADLCRSLSANFRLKCIRRENGGAGAARRAGVAQASGEYLLLINDDTIASSNLLAEHLRVQAAHPAEKWAVLGNFRYPPESRRRALTHFLSTRPFLCVQVTAVPGSLNRYSYFVTCNLSVRRRDVLDAGSFDPRFRVAEDIELGVRLEHQGFRVYYHPDADALHDLLGITALDLVRRAALYGKMNFLLFQKHPELLGDGSGPFGLLDDAARKSMENFVARNRSGVAEALVALQKFDHIDFAPFFDRRTEQGTAAADDVMALFDRAVPVLHWFHLYESFLQEWSHAPERRAAESPGPQLVREAHV